MSTIGEIDVNVDKKTLDSLNQLVSKTGCSYQSIQNQVKNITLDQDDGKVVDIENVNSGHRIKRDVSTFSSEQSSEHEFSEMEVPLNTEYEFLELYMALNESIRHRIGHQFSGFIKKCTFRGMSCLNIRF